jgi:hypothetical protein
VGLGKERLETRQLRLAQPEEIADVTAPFSRR